MRKQKSKNFYLYLKTIICSSSSIDLSLEPSTLYTYSLISALAITEEGRMAEEKKENRSRLDCTIQLVVSPEM